MLNGRNTVHNDYTSISVKGQSVVDYCIVPYENLSLYSQFYVHTVVDVMNSIELQDSIAPTCVPDHSILTWVMEIESTDLEFATDKTGSVQSTDKFDCSRIPNDFLLNQVLVGQINDCISNLEQGYRTQSDIDQAFGDWCGIVRDEMYDKLPFKTIIHDSCRRKRRSGKPWWSNELNSLWSDMCKKEKLWLRCNNKHLKVQLKTDYIRSRSFFDRAVQKAKRHYWFSTQSRLSNLASDNDVEFWKTIGTCGVGQERKKGIPLEVVLDNGTVSSKLEDVLLRWKNDFANLLNQSVNSNVGQHTSSFDNVYHEELDRPFSVFEVKAAIDRAKLNKATGIDQIPNEVLKNDMSVSFLHSLFCVCYETGMVPSMWGKNIINPIPKSSTADKRDPLQYRGISLACTMYKLYASILNHRLSSWSELNDKIEDEQNGFRKKRSTLDHISALTNIIDVRKKLHKSTFCSFIDFRRAYDGIERNLLWQRLNSIGVPTKMLDAIKALYASVSSCVRINSHYTDWFAVTTGLRQGCSLSPLLFNLFLNDLSVQIKAVGKGVLIEDELVCILCYADDLVLIAENEQDLQCMLDVLSQWCTSNSMVVNANKSNIVHFRPNSVPRSEFNFKCGVHGLTYVDKYSYLGLLLSEHLDFSISAKSVAQSASRALGLLIARYKSMGGMSFAVYSKMYNSTVWPVISYASAIWGIRTYACINAVENRALRFFMGVGKYTPSAALAGDMGWQPPLVKQYKHVCNLWHRFGSMNMNRVNRKVFQWTVNTAGVKCKNWVFSVKMMFKDLNLEEFCIYPATVSKQTFSDKVDSAMFCKFKSDWKDTVLQPNAIRGNGRNKLRTYCQFKNEYCTEEYCKMILPYRHRSAFAKFRCGVAPIMLEIGRYANVPVENRFCPNCTTCVESETHVMLYCPLYSDIRTSLFEKCHTITDFNSMSDIEKMVVLFSNKLLIRDTAKACYNILMTRNAYLYR
ncbi:uncharacterized protein LOC127861632 isoform X1 [Dreissena polymorpha]|uniref:uncharacterized protein LOC127861632 isoform X1 n=1 Tax=Dreissena polymorpha TaxID=45954 RepID=UPI00226459A3|nr:uncharacterized protein LOC127861632 isoform X1 [Dreissena polymorpha]XP_052256260.1 uncharacterized protein LOC127861632 isoform X1 [Dreissena polymorpha]XP_052256261.1 uncharacterized protein LOC127861632 isoform X1 [Dreissena polymorpha]XP_052256262.1 uncharacterized protein LOC127861632 isoform X1 [Dreissena polymorpha]XP_052256263.1 uncharacterized protein LOC127861632 isoform X1 [Dreissena polymorpha]XP_052256264.1 uncharacterized protein LOC127861632 isoform X1 [Dreissena polymorpha]